MNVAEFLLARVRDATNDRWPTDPDLLAVAQIAALAAGNARRLQAAIKARQTGAPYREPAERVAAEYSTADMCARILAARWYDHPDYDPDWTVP